MKVVCGLYEQIMPFAVLAAKKVKIDNYNMQLIWSNLYNSDFSNSVY